MTAAICPRCDRLVSITKSGRPAAHYGGPYGGRCYEYARCPECELLCVVLASGKLAKHQVWTGTLLGDCSGSGK